MTFANPEAFALFLPLIAIAMWQWTRGLRLRSRIPYPTADWMNARPKLRMPSPFRVHWMLRCLAMSLAIVGLARPQQSNVKVKRVVEGVDLMLVFDLSKSMDAVDFKPDRRTVAVDTLKAFVQSRTDDRMGLVLFSGEAYLATPLTTDHDVLVRAIEESSNRGLQDGTAIGQALAVAVRHLKNSASKSRVIILVTDGDNNMGSVEPISAAELAKGFQLKIYTVGIGKRGQVRLPIRDTDPRTGRSYIVREESLTDAVNDELLREIATRTGGRFFRAEDPNVLNSIFETINTLEKTKVETTEYRRVQDKAWPWLIAAFVVLMMEGFALNTRWRKFP